LELPLSSHIACAHSILLFFQHSLSFRSTPWPVSMSLVVTFSSSRTYSLDPNLRFSCEDCSKWYLQSRLSDVIFIAFSLET
jgi:hypothetical protein